MSTKKNKKLNYCVVSENCVAIKFDDTKLNSKSTISLILGSLVHVHSSISNTHVAIKIVNHEWNYDTSEESLWSCPKSKLLPVNEVLWPLISAVISPIDRVNILKNSALCDELSSIEIGSLVLHRCWDSNDPPEIAVVKYKGPISKLGHGTYFGIELLESKSVSNNDGSFAGQRYFHCPVGTGKFVPVNELRLSRSFSTLPSKPQTTSPQMVSRNSTNHMFKSTAILQLEDNTNRLSRNSEISRSSSSVLESDKVHLKPGDHVIWISDSGPLKGVVRWFGRQDNQRQMKVGVSFDEVTDKGDETEGPLLEIPILELVKAEDFYGNSTDIKTTTKARTKSDSSSKSEIYKDPVSKLRRSDSFRWNSSESQEIQKQNEKNCVQKDVVDFLSCEFPSRLALGTSNEKPTKLNNNLINISSSPASNSEEHEEKIAQEEKRLLAVQRYNDDALLSGSSGSDGSYYDTPEPNNQILTSDLGVGSMVEVLVHDEPHYGVIRWIGYIHGDKKPRKVAGIEMEEEHTWCSDGTFNGRRYFQCNPLRAFFVSLSQCRKDSRFLETQPALMEPKIKEFGQVDCPVIPGIVQPLCRDGDIEALCGKYRGIQGHHNSCYLDATLFSMFTFTSVFDSLLYRPATEADITDYKEVQRVLREEIVNPLRENLYVRADRVMKLRTLLEKLSSVTGLTSEEKDPEEFLTSLVAQILRAEPFLKLSSGQEAYHYQLFVEKDEQLTLPTVQQLFEQSFLSSDIKLKEVPSCLIIQMPRFGKSYKMYPRILPSQLLDVTDVIENSPRQCTVCGKLAEYECKQCFDQGIHDEGLQSISFCACCLDTAHSHERRTKHTWRQLHVPPEFSVLQEHCVIPRLFMELFAVVCIETSHYVAFVKCGTGSDAPWCFFDSMADRKGEQNGYNIPEMVPCPNFPYWLSEKGAQTLHQVKDDRQLPEHAKRLLCDAYMCMYRSSEVMMYR